MAQIKKVGDKYFIEFFGNGLRFEKLAGTELEHAQKMKAQIEESLKAQEGLYRDRFIALDTFFVEYSDFAKREYPWKTVERLKAVIIHFATFLQDVYPEVIFIQNVTPRIIEDYAAFFTKKYQAENKRPRPRLFNFTVFLLLFIFEEAIKRGYINDNPAAHFRWRPQGFKARSFDGLAPKIDRLLEGILRQKEREKKGLALSACLVDETLDLVELQAPLGLPPLNFAQIRRLAILNLLAKKASLTKIYQILLLEDVAELVNYIPLAMREF